MTTAAMSDREFLDLAAQGARSEWAASAGLRGEFKSADEYASFVFASGSGNAAAVGDGWLKEWRAKSDLQAEFPTAESYAAYRRADAKGKARQFKGRVVGAE